MSQRNGFYPRPDLDTTGRGVVSGAGAVTLVETVRAAGLDRGLAQALAPWRKPFAVHDPGKIITDVALSLAIGGDCLADLAVLRAEPDVYGHVASDPTVSRLIALLAGDADRAVAAINTARAQARTRVWSLAGSIAPNAAASRDSPLVIDLDATLITAHSEKENAAPTYKRGFGFHPLWAFADHGPTGTGEPLAVALRAGNAGSNTAVDHIAVTRDALAQLPGHTPGTRPGRRVLIRVDGAGSSKEYLHWLTRRRLGYSVGFGLPTDFANVLRRIPEQAWTPAYDADGGIRDGAAVAEVSDLLNLTTGPRGWPEGMRIIIRRERPHPGAQLRITDVDGNRITAFATNTATGGPGTQLPDLEVRHRARARVEDRIRNAKDTGLTNLPLHGFNANRIWCHLVALACDLLAWLQLLAFSEQPATADAVELANPAAPASGWTPSDARRWEPKKLRHRLFGVAARTATHARTDTLHLSATAPGASLALHAVTRLRALTAVAVTAAA